MGRLWTKGTINRAMLPRLVTFFLVIWGTQADVKQGVYKVYRCVPQDKDQLIALTELYRKSTELELDFWKEPRDVDGYVDIMTPPAEQEMLTEFFREHGIDYKITIGDVEKLIIQREKSELNPWSKFNSSDPVLASFFRKRMSDDFVTSNKAKYGFGDYHSYDTITAWLDDIQRFYPSLAQTFIIGTTFEGRQIKGIKIGSPVHATNKRIIWVDAGIHAREWASTHTALYFIEQLITKYGIDPQITAYMDTLNFYILPQANPDGYEYSRSDVGPQTRFWRKNRGKQVCKKDHWRRERCCGGVDLNRNFDFHWGESGSSDDLCSDIYQGSSAFSEPETRAIRDKIMSQEMWGKVDAFITLHTYSQMWIHPFNHERKSFPNDVQDLINVGQKGVDAIEKVYGTKYRFGTGADILYPSAGGSDDWAKAKANVKYVFLLELRPGEEEWDGFLLDRRQLIPTGRETWEGVKTVVDAVMAKARPKFSPQIPEIRRPPPPVEPPRFLTGRIVENPTTAMATTPTPFATTISQLVTFPRNGDSMPINRNTAPVGLNQVVLNQEEARRRFEERLRQQQQVRQQIIQNAQQSRRVSQSSGTTGQCLDRSRWCGVWLQQNPALCEQSTIYMSHDCARTCRFCR
uniref:ShKT domain-containing protein n=1 Tax=Bursaphelenchus xylophilus TaxID=6326 RepID=A0A1I7RLL2_BURXY